MPIFVFMKNIVIIGASRGIGRSLAHQLSRTNRVLALSRNLARLEELKDLTLAENLKVAAADLSAPNLKEYLTTVFNQELGKIDILINNAGISMRALFEEIEMDVFKKVMDINFYGTLYATKYCLPEILKTKGSIVGVSSINGYRGTPARTAYTASKYAMNGFMESLRTEVMHRGVHVLVACPGFTGTNIRNAALTADGASQGESPRDEGKMMSPEEVAQGIIKAIQKRKRDIVFTSQGKLAVFLNKWMPGRMDKIVFNVFAKEPDSPFSAKK